MGCVRDEECARKRFAQEVCVGSRKETDVQYTGIRFCWRYLKILEAGRVLGYRVMLQVCFHVPIIHLVPNEFAFAINDTFS